VIPKETEAEIVRLYHGEKWPIGTIAGQLGIHHTTVQRVLRQTGVDRKVVAPRPSMIDPYVPFVVEQLEKYPGLRASRLFVMIKERGYPGGPDHLRRLVGRLRPRKAAEAFQRLRTMPGEQAQVDCPRRANDSLRLIIGGAHPRDPPTRHQRHFLVSSKAEGAGAIRPGLLFGAAS
jgi:hypothetical protein